MKLSPEVANLILHCVYGSSLCYGTNLGFGLHCEFTDTNIIGIDAPQRSNYSKKQTLLQHPTDQVPYNTRCKATKAKSKKFMQQTINVH